VDTENGAAGVSHFSDPETPKSQQKPTSTPHKLDKSVQAKRPSGRLPTEFVQEVRDRADIVRIVSDAGVKLKPVGSEWKGRCPFHQDKTASFSVNQGKGVFKCFGCDEGGNVFNFVMQSQAVGFRDAVEIVAGLVGMSLPEDEAQPPKARAARASREFTVEPDLDAVPSGWEDTIL
jgi:hypothetical protein